MTESERQRRHGYYEQLRSDLMKAARHFPPRSIERRRGVHHARIANRYATDLWHGHDKYDTGRWMDDTKIQGSSTD